MLDDIFVVTLGQTDNHKYALADTRELDTIDLYPTLKDSLY